MRRRRLAPIAAITLGLAACGPTEHAEVTGVVRDGRSGRALSDAQVIGPGGASAAADEEGRFTIRLPVDDEVPVRAAAADRCAGDAIVDVESAAGEVTIHLFPRLELETEYPQVGFDQEVRVEARTRCDEDAVLRWSQVGGPELGPERMRVEDGGRLVSVRTHALEHLVELDPRLGVVPLSRRERGDYRLRVETELAGRAVQREVRITAAPTAAGVFQVPTGADMYLNGGEGHEQAWTLLSKPEGSRAEMIDADTRTPHFRPDRFGQYMVRHEPTRLDINIQAGPFDQVPRDCGREGCHRPEDLGWAETRHARTFRRGLDGELGPTFDERCWPCHATGADFGLENGGMVAMARSMGWQQPAPRPGLSEQVPRLVRRHGAVWCSACHGPGRILPPQFHWEYGYKYQSGVCARCHDVVDDPDAPHPATHYREWAQSAMSTFVGDTLEADDPALRRGCASCHSAQGFVAWQRRGEHVVPDPGSVAAISCQTCHDPHDASRPRAIRVHETVTPVAGREATGLGTGALCVACHRSGVAQAERESMAPHAPQADVLLGRGSALVRDTIAGGHSRLADSCVACHMAQPLGNDPLRGRAGGHTFSVRDLGAEGPGTILSLASCASCHGTDTPPHAIGGIRDWDGDGRADDVGRDFDRALAAARAALRERIPFARVHDECPEPRLAADFVERDALLLLTDAEGVLLGDCDGDGRFTGREQRVGIDQMSRALRKVVWDVALLEKDGSRGRHNPTFAFRLLRAIRRELQ